jgi:hypothetical protein
MSGVSKFLEGKVRRLCEVVLAVLTILGPRAAFATPPSAPKRTFQERVEIEQLRYHEGDTFSEAEKKFLTNANRECGGYAYALDDRDLRVRQIQNTYPEAVSRPIIERNLLNLCPAFVLDQTTTLNLNESKRLLRRYFQGTESFQQLALGSVLWTIIPMSDLLASNCSAEDIQVFQKVYCFYASTEQPVLPGAPLLSGSLKNGFVRKCPLAQQNLSCGPQ